MSVMMARTQTPCLRGSSCRYVLAMGCLGKLACLPAYIRVHVCRVANASVRSCVKLWSASWKAASESCTAAKLQNLSPSLTYWTGKFLCKLSIPTCVCS